jgi:CRP/FNR family cyclic AMP-dependent transcriptional regulator
MDLKRMFKDWENRRSFEAGAVIFHENDPADSLYVILSGKVQLSIKGEVLGTEEEGGIIGEMAISNPTAHNSAAVALTPLVVAQLDQKQFTHLIRNEPDFSQHAMAVLANRLRAVDSYISSRLD